MEGPDGRPRSTMGHLHIIDREACYLHMPTPTSEFFCTYVLLAFLFQFLVFITLSIIV
jgi:hypothetical protein